MWWQLLRMWHWSLGEPGEKRRHSHWMEIARSPPSLLLSPPASNRRFCSQAFRSDALSPVTPSPLALFPRSSQCASLVPEVGNSPGQTRVAAVTGKVLGRFSLQLLSVPRPQIPSHTFQLSFPAPCCDSLSAHPLHISAHKSYLVTRLSTSAR